MVHIRAAEVAAIPPHLAACDLLDLGQSSRDDERRQFGENVRQAFAGLMDVSPEIADRLLGNARVINVFDDDGNQVQEIFLDRR